MRTLCLNLFVAVATVISASITYAQSEASSTVQDAVTFRLTTDEAIKASLRILGIAEDDLATGSKPSDPVAMSATARHLGSEEVDETPFVAVDFGKHATWQVDLKNVRLRLMFATGDSWRLEPMSIQVRFSDQDHSVVSIVATSDAISKQELAPYPDSSMAAERISAGGNETWSGRLPSAPSQSLASVLAAIHSSFGLPRFQEARINCVLWSMLGTSPRPAWSVHLRGLANVAASDPPMTDLTDRRIGTTDELVSDTEVAVESEIPLSMRNHLRHIVFDDTGKWHTAGTRPQPARLLDWEQRKLEERVKSTSEPAVTAPFQGGK